MRIAVFGAVVAAHIALVWYFLTLWHVAAASEEDADEPSMTLVFLPPLEPTTASGSASEPVPPAPAASRNGWQAPLLYRAKPGSAERVVSMPRRHGQVEPPQPTELAQQTKSVGEADSRAWRTRSEPVEVGEQSAMASSPTPSTSSPSGTTPDWRTQAEIVAQADAQHIVESEDRTARQAGALMAMIKPHPGPHNPVTPFAWDPNPHLRWQPAQGGGYRMALNDHCEVFFLIMVFVGCTVGELPPARGDLFKNMHPPVKFGDWDWRLDDP